MSTLPAENQGVLMADQMVLQAQKFVNATYGSRTSPS
jgi:hypothetical protein